MLDLGFFMNLYISIVVCMIGLVMGSFINCVAWRIVHKEEFIRGRSHCAFCGHTLSPLELIPIFSYLFQGGKSRCCKEKISLRYPITELITGIVFVILLWKFGFTWDTPMFMILGLLLLAVTLVDLDTGFIPDQFIIVGIINFILFGVLKGGEVFAHLASGVISGLAIAVPILLLSLLMDKVLKKETMGGGDIKLYFMVGLFFDIKTNIFLVLISCLIGILFTLVFQNIRVDDKEDSLAFPFGPSIAMATMLSIFIAEPIINFYMGLF